MIPTPIDRLRRELEVVGPSALDAFWTAVEAGGTPLVEPIDETTSLVTFVWRGSAEKTTLEWGLELPLERLDGTDLWHVSVPLPSDVSTVYYFAHGANSSSAPRGRGEGTTHIDLMNPRTFLLPADPDDPADYDVWLSVLELPLAPRDSWSGEPPPGVRGRDLEAMVDSAALGGPRRVGLHLPPDGAPDGLPLVVVLDGYFSRRVLRVPNTIDNLVAAGRIPPVAVVFVPTPDSLRFDELIPSSAIAEFVTDELLPWVAREWGIAGDPARNVIAGSSLGGLAAGHVALRRPDVFSAVLSQSGSFWWPLPADGEPEWLTRQYAASPRLPLRFYLDVGRLEGGTPAHGRLPQIVVNRRLREVLCERGYQVAYQEFPGHHDPINWRRTFAEGLVALLGVDVHASIHSG